MGEEVEMVDVNGKVVKVALDHLLDVLAKTMQGRVPYKCSTAGGGWLNVDITDE
jgi:hypothetical protein